MKHLPGMLAGAVITFAAMFAVSALAVLPVPGIQGPWLGDTNVNLYSLWSAITNDNQVGFSSAVTAGPANAQATCTNLTNAMNNVNSSVGSGSLCLPPASAGREVYIGNGSGQTVNIFGSATPFTPGTQDTINGTTGSTAYTSTTNGKNANCFAPANGVWFCTAGN